MIFYQYHLKTILEMIINIILFINDLECDFGNFSVDDDLVVKISSHYYNTIPDKIKQKEKLLSDKKREENIDIILNFIKD